MEPLWVLELYLQSGEHKDDRGIGVSLRGLSFIANLRWKLSHPDKPFSQHTKVSVAKAVANSKLKEAMWNS